MKFTTTVEFELIEVEVIDRFERDGPKVGSTRFTFGAKEHPGADEYLVFCTSVLTPEVAEDLQASGKDSLAEFVWNMTAKNAAMDMVYYAGQAGKFERRVAELEAALEAKNLN